MKKERTPPFKLCPDTLAAVAKELIEFSSSYARPGISSESLLILCGDLEKLIRRHCLACQGTSAIICGDYQLGIRSNDEVIAILFVPPNDCTPSALTDAGFESSDLHDVLLDAHYTIIACTTTSISLTMTLAGSTLFYHISLATDPASPSFYNRSMISSLSRLYLSSPDAVSLYLLLWKMAIHSITKQATSSSLSHHGEQFLSVCSPTSHWLPLPEELLYLRLHIHLLTFYFVTGRFKKRLRILIPEKNKGTDLLTMLVTLADHIGDLQHENAIRPSCIVTDWSICSLIQGPAAVKLGVPEAGSLYFASYGLAGLLPFNDKGGRFVIFLMTMRSATLKLLSAMKLNLQSDKYYISILIGNYQSSSMTDRSSSLSNQPTPLDFSFRMVIASSEASSVPSSLHSTPTQKRMPDSTTDMHTRPP